MSIKTNNTRRQFLRNSALATLAAGLMPGIIKAKNLMVSREAGDCSPTTLDYYGEGPFYTPNAPVMTDNQLAAQSEPGTRLIISGQVKTIDCKAVIPDTLIDVWHADSSGAYDSSGFNLRGKTSSNTQGFYTFETVLPGKYLNGSKYRPSHIHFRITPPGRPAIITQLYFEGDVEIPGDAAASITSGPYDASSRIIPIVLNGQGKYEGTWDIAVDADGSVGVADLHLDKGIVYSVTPNPISEMVQIHYGIFKRTRVNIQVFDMQGRRVADLGEQDLKPQKYSATWKPPGSLPAGVYFVALKLNDLQVHYLKVMKS